MKREIHLVSDLQLDDGTHQKSGQELNLGRDKLKQGSMSPPKKIPAYWEVTIEGYVESEWSKSALTLACKPPPVSLALLPMKRVPDILSVLMLSILSPPPVVALLDSKTESLTDTAVCWLFLVLIQAPPPLVVVAKLALKVHPSIVTFASWSWAICSFNQLWCQYTPEE